MLESLGIATLASLCFLAGIGVDRLALGIGQSEPETLSKLKSVVLEEYDESDVVPEDSE